MNIAPRGSQEEVERNRGRAKERKSEREGGAKGGSKLAEK